MNTIHKILFCVGFMVSSCLYANFLDNTGSFIRVKGDYFGCTAISIEAKKDLNPDQKTDLDTIVLQAVRFSQESAPVEVRGRGSFKTAIEGKFLRCGNASFTGLKKTSEFRIYAIKTAAANDKKITKVSTAEYFDVRWATPAECKLASYEPLLLKRELDAHEKKKVAIFGGIAAAVVTAAVAGGIYYAIKNKAQTEDEQEAPTSVGRPLPGTSQFGLFPHNSANLLIKQVRGEPLTPQEKGFIELEPTLVSRAAKAKDYLEGKITKEQLASKDLNFTPEIIKVFEQEKEKKDRSSKEAERDKERLAQEARDASELEALLAESEELLKVTAPVKNEGRNKGRAELSDLERDLIRFDPTLGYHAPKPKGAPEIFVTEKAFDQKLRGIDLDNGEKKTVKNR